MQKSIACSSLSTWNHLFSLVNAFRENMSLHPLGERKLLRRTIILLRRQPGSTSGRSGVYANIFQHKFRQFINSICSSIQIFSIFPRFRISSSSPTMGFIRNYFLRLNKAKFCKNLLLSASSSLESKAKWVKIAQVLHGNLFIFSSVLTIRVIDEVINDRNKE